MTKTSRELQLDKRDKFFSDPIFKDILSFNDTGLQTKLDQIKNKGSSSLTLFNPNTSLSALQRSEAAHNLQVTCSNDKFMIQLELPGFFPEDFKLKTLDDVIILEANHEGGADNGDEFTSRKYTKEFQMPEGVQPEFLASSYNSSGILTIEAPRQLQVPEGAEVQEAMAAKSKAYTTDDGKTAVNEKSQASSQVIAATTESPDGRTKSSISYSSSSSAASTIVSSGDPVMSGGSFFDGGFPALNSGFGNNNNMGMLQNFPNMSENFPQMSMNFPPLSTPSNFPPFPPMNTNFPRMNTSFPQMSVDMDMDSMMQRMMSGMSMNDRGMPMNDQQRSMTNKTSKNSFSEMTSMQQQQQQQRHQQPPIRNQQQNDMFANMDMGRPKFGLQMGRMGHDLDIEELSNAGSDISSSHGGPGYTVTSPPPSSANRIKSHFPETTTHSVKPSSDFVTLPSQQDDPQSDCTVLLKLKEGNEYKLVLNMQQYSPDDITVKLNDDRELTIIAHSQTDGQEDFMQRHLVPKGIDLERLTSSFSEDGILVIKAPKLKK